MNRSELFDLMEALTTLLDKDTVLSELVKGLSTDELQFQLQEIVRLYDLEEYV